MLNTVSISRFSCELVMMFVSCENGSSLPEEEDGVARHSISVSVQSIIWLGSSSSSLSRTTTELGSGLIIFTSSSFESASSSSMM